MRLENAGLFTAGANIATGVQLGTAGSMRDLSQTGIEVLVSGVNNGCVCKPSRGHYGQYFCGINCFNSGFTYYHYGSGGSAGAK